jgi:hypothetical protein
MKSSLVVIDEFLDNPEECRIAALNVKYPVTGNYPGRRSPIVGPYNDLIKESFTQLIGAPVSDVTTFFQYTLATDRSWIHNDREDWAAVLYLTPDAPPSSGTGQFRHRETGIMSRLNATPEQQALLDSEAQDLTRWDKVAEVGNVFNRLVLYPGHYYHMSLDYFGKAIEEARLFQVFFINLEKNPNAKHPESSPTDA